MDVETLTSLLILVFVVCGALYDVELSPEDALYTRAAIGRAPYNHQEYTQGH